MAKLNQNWEFDDQANFTMTDGAGKAVQPPGDCLQELGHQNSPATCEVLLTPRILMITSVPPARRSTRTLKMGDGQGAANEDIAHDYDLIAAVAPQLSPIA